MKETASFPRPWAAPRHRRTREWSRGRSARPRTTARLRRVRPAGFWPRLRSSRNARRWCPCAGSAGHPTTRATPWRSPGVGATPKWYPTPGPNPDEGPQPADPGHPGNSDCRFLLPVPRETGYSMRPPAPRHTWRPGARPAPGPCHRSCPGPDRYPPVCETRTVLASTPVPGRVARPDDCKSSTWDTTSRPASRPTPRDSPWSSRSAPARRGSADTAPPGRPSG